MAKAKTKPDPALLPFRRERILAVGTLAALGPVPLVFTGAVGPAVLAAYLGLVVLLLLLVRKGRIPCLGDAWLNLAGVLYVALFWVDIRYGSRSLLKTALHILLFTTVLKLASIKRERDFSVALTLATFLLVASMATSTHSTILLFLGVYAVVAWPILCRWALFRDLAAAPDEWHRDERARGIPVRKAVAASLAASLAFAVPVFVLLPRLKSSYISGLPVGDPRDTGFSDTVDTNLYGRLRQSDQVFLRVAVEDGPIGQDPPFLRIRLLAHTRFDRGVWKRPGGRGRLLGMREGAPVSLLPEGAAAPRPTHRLSLEVARLGVNYLPSPVNAISAAASPELLRRFGTVPLVRDRSGNLHLPFEPPALMRFEILTGADPVVDFAPPGEGDSSREPMGSEVLLAFGREAGAGIDPVESPFLFARRIEEHLATRFFYTLDSARWGPNAVEEFLTRRRSGHCETFATAMALVLREHGIPSRLVTGFAGGERGPFGSYFLVRGVDAHAWVEAWCGPRLGWVSFDPTPPDGRPGVSEVNLLRSARQLFENLEFLYGRYVLGFAQVDQLSLAMIVRDGAESVAGALQAAVRRLRGLAAVPVTARPGLLSLAIAAVLLAGFLLRRVVAGRSGFGTRGLPAASAAYRKLQGALRRRGADLTPASAPVETLASAERLGAGRISREIVKAYVAESFGGRETSPAEAERLGVLLKELRSGRPHA